MYEQSISRLPKWGSEGGVGEAHTVSLRAAPVLKEKGTFVQKGLNTG
ncbi:MAG: hypothetical protein ACFFCW_23860 [Candidatus Hodarchaeota archaeon]